MEQHPTPNNIPPEPPSNYGPGREQEKTNTHAIVGFVLGIVGLLAWCLPILGFPVSMAGVFFSILGLKSEEKKIFAIIGLILSILSFFASLINSIMGILINSGAINV